MSYTANAIDAAIYSKLTASAALTSLTSGGTANPGVYQWLAPENADPPYVIYNVQSPSVPRRTMGTAVAFEDTVYLVKAVTQEPSAKLAGSILARIDEALNDQPLTIGGYTHLYLRRESGVEFPEVSDGLRYMHRGGLYRLMAQPAA